VRVVLITGAAGFIGSALVRHLYAKFPDYKIVVLDALTYAGNLDNIPYHIKHDSKRFEFWQGDVRNTGLVNSLVERAEIVVHLAASSHVARSIFDNISFYENDVIGTQSMANAVANHNNVERFIHMSTSEVYGTACEIPMTEEHPLLPTNPYASAKCGADRLVYSYWKTYDIPAVIIRSFNVYGCFQHLEKVIPRFITCALQDKPLTIHGTGEYTRDWNYVEDTCDALDRVMHAPIETVKGQVINVGTGKDTSIKVIAEMILKKLNKPEFLIVHMSGRPGQLDRHISSTDKSLRLLGWKSTTNFDEGLSKTILWYQQNKEWWQKIAWMACVPTKNRDGSVEYY